ncbi:hypothetical protein SMICM304S_05804 [Streptomyces microflavus]
MILEPDALPHIADGCTPPEHHAERYQLLSEAVDTLKAKPRTKVYLDAGDPDWIVEPYKIAEPLRLAGIDRARLLTERLQLPVERECTEYGALLSDSVGGAHYVIDTSRNGGGPLSAWYFGWAILYAWYWSSAKRGESAAGALRPASTTTAAAGPGASSAIFFEGR